MTSSFVRSTLELLYLLSLVLLGMVLSAFLQTSELDTHRHGCVAARMGFGWSVSCREAALQPWLELAIGGRSSPLLLLLLLL